MREKGWSGELKELFKDYPYNPQAPKTYLPETFLNEFDLTGLLGKDLQEEWKLLHDAEYKQARDAMIHDLWYLANFQKLLPETRYSLYKRFSERYEHFFDWKSVSDPGWGGF